ncbi:MAG: creatininase family protein [Pseudorhodoplanes sp.]
MRSIGDLTSPEIAERLRKSSVLCLPMGALEQHGPHLPLNTDTVIAEGFTRLLVSRLGETFDLWQLPTIALGLSREHEGAPGTVSLSIETFVAQMRELGREIARALPARNLLIVNGHGGNRGVLETLILDLRHDHGVRACVVHPLLLSGIDVDADIPDVHGAKSETSMMLALAPHLVRRDQIAKLKKRPDRDVIRATVLRPGVAWPWTSDDPRISDLGIIGDVKDASQEFGTQILDRAVENARDVLERLCAP